MTSIDPSTVARAYIEAVGRHDLAPLPELLADDLTARFAGTPSTRQEWIDALDRLLPVLRANENIETFIDGDRVAVAYDFVTDTPAGAVRCVELLTVRDGRIHEIELVLDRVAFAPVRDALARIAAKH
jgi:ketosteroid isomerase-like protein